MSLTIFNHEKQRICTSSTTTRTPSAISPFPFNFGTLKSTTNKIPVINIKVPYK